ncbi:unnamed protein product [Darwinula stevensoni]|uniref:RING-type E3 ubiquitin transferase n=1 Tax=Darwinula stevensoni TaxID=69355 RepID=A0A7R8ZYB4_9CRUS|nr:unnamed protein product [Darwinula stevensoni]CAG0881196.1 unnamed protein product [Darwinula stevensoni]
MSTNQEDHAKSQTLSHGRQQQSRGKVEALECRVCEDAFTNHGDKVPRLLQCGHTLCHSCLQQLNHQDFAVLCPFDRLPTVLGPGGVWELKKNFALLELLEKLQIADNGDLNSPDLQILNKEKELRICCDENEEHLAVLYCVVCGSHLCVECSERTHATKTLCRHRRVPLSQKPKERPRCEFHSQHVAEFICLEDGCQGNPLMCFICRDYGRHAKHRHGLLETEVEAFRDTVMSTILSFRKFTEDASEILRKLESVVCQIEGGDTTEGNRENSNPMQSMLGTARTARERVQLHFAELREHIALKECAALAVVESHIRERLGCIRQHQENLTAMLSQVREVSTQWEKALMQDDARVMLAAPSMKVLSNSMEKEHQLFTETNFNHLLDPSIPITFTKAVIFVIDSSVRERLPEAHTELAKLMAERDLKEATLLILANKQDVGNCLRVEEIMESLCLYKLCCGRSWHIVACDVPSGNGLQEGLDWLAKQLLEGT